MRRCAEVKSKFAFFQEQRERFAIDSVVFAQDAFCLIPKILNAVDVVLAVCKFLGMVDAVMDKTAHVQLVVAAQTIRVNNNVDSFVFGNGKSYTADEISKALITENTQNNGIL